MKSKNLVFAFCLFLCVVPSIGAFEVTAYLRDAETQEALAGWFKITDPSGKAFFPNDYVFSEGDDSEFFYAWETFNIDLKTKLRIGIFNEFCSVSTITSSIRFSTYRRHSNQFSKKINHFLLLRLFHSASLL